MLPNPQHAPTHSLKATLHLPITHAIPSNFTIPVCLVLLRSPAVPRTAMPKAAIDKDAEPFFPKDKIWTPDKSLPAPPTYYLVLSE